MCNAELVFDAKLMKKLAKKKLARMKHRNAFNENGRLLLFVAIFS